MYSNDYPENRFWVRQTAQLLVALVLCVACLATCQDRLNAREAAQLAAHPYITSCVAHDPHDRVQVVKGN